MLLLALTLVGAGGCDSADSLEIAADDSAALAPEGVEWQPALADSLVYVSDWDWSGAERIDGAWVFETDLGLRVGLELGYVASASLMLVACSEAEQGEESFRSHSASEDDSLLTGPWVEGFADPQVREYGSAAASGERYCALHWLAAASDAAADDGHALASDSVEVAGWYEASDGVRRSFSASVSLANGVLRSLYSDALPEPGSDAIVRLVRYPARALDGVDIESLTASELAFEFLQGLGRTSEVWIESVD
jgi:hypothetical protein